MKKRTLFIFTAFTLIFSLSFAGCKKEEQKEIVIKMFTNLSDREYGQGYVEQQIIDEYMSLHPQVKIEVEAMDDVAYKTKFKIYCREKLPDIVSVWGSPAFMSDGVNAGVFMELDKSFYADYGFVQKSLEGFTYNGKLYGLPRNTDVALLFYNESMFEDFGWKIPENVQELIELSKEIKSHGVTPVSIAGSDGWPLMMFFSNILHSLSGSEYPKIIEKAVTTGDFSDRRIKQALDIFCSLTGEDSVLFQQGYTTQDDGTASNLFLSYKSAMYYMGSWQCSMAVNKNNWDAVIPYIRVMTLPRTNGMAEKDKSLFAWYGGGYAVSSETRHKTEVMDFYNFIFEKENLSKKGLLGSVGLSAQDEKEFLTENIHQSLKQLISIVDDAEIYSGTPLNDAGSAFLKYVSEEKIIKLASGQISKEQFLKELSDASEK